MKKRKKYYKLEKIVNTYLFTILFFKIKKYFFFYNVKVKKQC